MDPKKVKRCYYCNAKTKVLKSGEICIFHFSHCKPAHTKVKGEKKYEIEKTLPGITHGGYL